MVWVGLMITMGMVGETGWAIFMRGGADISDRQGLRAAGKALG